MGSLEGDVGSSGGSDLEGSGSGEWWSGEFVERHRSGTEFGFVIM